jgi:hypothetical protein
MRAHRRLARAAVVLAASLASSGCPLEEEPCTVSNERCAGNTVQACLGPTDNGYWVDEKDCAAGTVCTDRGCTGGHTACCVAVP